VVAHGDRDPTRLCHLNGREFEINSCSVTSRHKQAEKVAKWTELGIRHPQGG
jgi:hypothetical protein